MGFILIWFYYYLEEYSSQVMFKNPKQFDFLVILLEWQHFEERFWSITVSLVHVYVPQNNFLHIFCSSILVLIS